MMRRAKVALAIALPAIVGVAFIAGWGTTLARNVTPQGSLATLIPWPVVCTTRGCLTTVDWAKQLVFMSRFAESLKQAAPTKEQALTSAVRRHLIEHVDLPEVATVSDARRYREEILHLKDEKLLQETVGLPFAEYDALVILPFLKQTALQQQYRTESPEELYATLSQKRWVAVLPFHFRWDKDTARVVTRD